MSFSHHIPGYIPGKCKYKNETIQVLEANMNKFLYSLGVGKFSFAMIWNPEQLKLFFIS